MAFDNLLVQHLFRNMPLIDPGNVPTIRSIAENDPEEQEKIIIYNDLVAVI
jgi:hypothetical protein